METMKTNSEFGTVLSVRERSEGNVNVTYMLFESPFQIDGRHIYSIAVETHSDCGDDTVSVCDVSRNKEEAMKLLDILVNGMVTSCTLYEILEDIL